MANVSNFEVNGVSYSYDTESRNPLADKVKIKTFEGGLVYDINTKEPTEVVGVPANNLKAAGKASETSAEPVEPSEPVDISKPTYGDHNPAALALYDTGDFNKDTINMDTDFAMYLVNGAINMREAVIGTINNYFDSMFDNLCDYQNVKNDRTKVEVARVVTKHNQKVEF